MARNLTRKHIHDLNQNLTIGVAFPLDEINMFKGTKTIKDQLKSNLLNLLLTDPGERVMQPKFGVGLKKLLFETKINTQNLNDVISDQIQRYIPQVELLDSFVLFNPDDHKLSIKIDYKFKIDNSQDSVQLNFLE
tara:strand:- start:4085 stop:4489 length:405 start_codon:yes stop_codon:yes gene_type:complete